MWTCTCHGCTVTQRQPCCIPEQNTGQGASWVVRSAVVLLERCCLHPFLQHQKTFFTNLWFAQPRHVLRVNLSITKILLLRLWELVRSLWTLKCVTSLHSHQLSSVCLWCYQQNVIKKSLSGKSLPMLIFAIYHNSCQCTLCAVHLSKATHCRH